MPGLILQIKGTDQGSPGATYIYVYTAYLSLSMYIYIYIERERERDVVVNSTSKWSLNFILLFIILYCVGVRIL